MRLEAYPHDLIHKNLESFGISEQIISLIMNSYNEAATQMQRKEVLTEKFTLGVS
jgi:SOS response regulatory protein OraA/RecX